MKKNRKANNILSMSMFITDIETTLTIFELAKKNGKKAGDSCQEEFEIILKERPEKFTYIGKTEEDIDLLTGNLRERGLKILNIKEIDRRKQYD